MVVEVVVGVVVEGKVICGTIGGDHGGHLDGGIKMFVGGCGMMMMSMTRWW